MKKYFSGIDIGSTSIKIVIIDSEGKIGATSVSPTGSLFYKNTVEAYDRLMQGNAATFQA